MLRLTGVVRNYAWGDHNAIPSILGIAPTGEPVAEYWLGAHPQGSATLADGESLHDAITADPIGLLGDRVAGEWGRLPFLPKILAADCALSIQTHPDLETAKRGFSREEALGIPRDAPERTYRDDNHKPELICAVTPFEALCGFRRPAAIAADLASYEIDLLDEFCTMLRHEAAPSAVLGSVLARVLRLPPSSVSAVVAAMGDRAPSWLRTVATDFPGDPGLLVTLLLNHVVLNPGEALYLGAGNLHCYLRGTGVEVMANSDNVIRGGLTPKHIDVDELLAVVDTAPVELSPQRPTGPVTDYVIPSAEFALTRLDLGGTPVTQHGGRPMVVIAVEGDAWIEAAGTSARMAQGDAVFVGAAEGDVRIDGSGLAFVVGTGPVDA